MVVSHIPTSTRNDRDNSVYSRPGSFETAIILRHAQDNFFQKLQLRVSEENQTPTSEYVE